MVNYDRIKQKAKEQGITLSFLCKKIDMYPTYIADLKRKSLNMPEDRLKLTAEILNCSIAYLKGETDNPADENLLDYVSNIDDDLLEKCGDLYHAQIAQEERNRSSVANKNMREKIESVIGAVAKSDDNKIEGVVDSIVEKLQKAEKVKPFNEVIEGLDEKDYDFIKKVKSLSPKRRILLENLLDSISSQDNE